MHSALLACLALVLVSCSGPRSAHVFDPSKGHARFEVLGMLDDYMCRPLGRGSFIERFYPGEAAEADRFEKLLGEFCTEESLPAHWRRNKEKEGHITFSGLEIAKAINSNYKAFDDGFYTHSSIGPAGMLSPAVLKSATEADLLRYVTGCYARCGDHAFLADSKAPHRAVFSRPNCSRKFELLADVLERLGCSKIRLYHSQELIPTTLVLTFCPSQKVKESTGIRREVSAAEMNKWRSQSHLVQYSIP